jgi:hypothetical protein
MYSAERKSAGNKKPEHMAQELVQKYFPALPDEQLKKLEQFAGLLAGWNEKVNLVSRKDMDHLEERHILHSLAIGFRYKFAAGSRIMSSSATRFRLATRSSRNNATSAVPLC